MPSNIVGGNNRYPSLQSICQLFRVVINDTGAGATGTPGEGNIMPNTNPDLLTILSEATGELFSDLRNVGDPALILDNYILENIPQLAAPDPTVRVTLSYTGFNNGFTWSNLWTLPISCDRVLMMWERWSNTGLPFLPMRQVHALPPTWQLQNMDVWAMEQNAVVMPGALQMVDLRIRCRIGFPEYFDPTNLDFQHTYVPILASRNAIAAKMRVIYASRFAPDQYQLAIAEETRQMDKLKLEVVRQQQSILNQSAPFGEEAVYDMSAVYWAL